MDDWQAPAPEPYEYAAPDRLVRAAAADAAAVEELAQLLEQAESPALVAGAGADDPETWAALAALAERLGAPVWQEPFGARAGFPQDAPALRGRPLRRPRQAPRGALRPRRRPRRRCSRLPPVRLCGRPVRRGRNGRRRRHGGSRRGAAQPGAARRARAAGVGVRRARRAPAAARQPSRRAPRPAPEPPPPGGALRAGHVLVRAGRPAAARRDRARGGALEPSGAARSPSRQGKPGPDQSCDGRARVRDAGRDRPAPGASLAPRGRDHRRRLVALRDPVALECGDVRSRARCS